MKAPEPAELLLPLTEAEAEVGATAESEVQADREVLPEAAVAEATAAPGAQEAPPMRKATAEVAAAMAAQVVPEAATFMAEPEEAADMGKPVPAEAVSGSPARGCETTAELLPEGAEADPWEVPIRSRALADPASASSPTTHKEARQ